MTIEAPLKTDAAFARLRLPEEFHRVSPFATALYLAHALVFFLGPALVAFALVDVPMPLPARVGLAIALGLIGGHGMHLLTFVGHEGMHTNLHANKYVSAALAVLFSAPVPFFFIVGFAMTHWKHHRFTDQNIDPDGQVYSNYKTFASRLFLARSGTVRIYLKNALRMALGLPWPQNTRLPFSEGEMRWISRINIALGLCCIGVYTLIWQRSAWLGFTVMLMPYFTLYMLSALRAYMEHTGTAPGRYLDSRSYTSPIYTALFFGSNYHLEHHLYPAVPCYRLPALHGYLAARGLLSAPGIQVEPSFLGALRCTTARFPYPCVNRPSTSDEFLERVAGGRFDRNAVVAAERAGEAMVAVARE